MRAQRSLPTTDEDSQPFWDACGRHELQIQRCDACGYYVYFPGPICRKCGSSELTWTLMSGRGTVYSFVVVHHVVTPRFPPDQPYVVAWVELAEQPPVRLLTNIVDCQPEQVHIGQQVAVRFEDL